MDEKKERALTEEILADARRQAQRKLSTARQNAERVVQLAQAQTQTVRENALKAARQKLEHDRSLILADVPHQKQVRSLQAKENIISTLFDQTLEALRSRSGFDVFETLVQLSTEAAAQMDADSIVLEVADRDAEAFGDKLTTEVASRVAGTHGKQVMIKVLPSQDMADGGVIARSADGRQMIDNAFATRLSRARARLRGQLAAMLFEEGSE